MRTAPRTPDGHHLAGVASPLKLSVTPAIPPTAAPRLGHDTIAVLTGLLAGQALDLAELMAKGVIAAPPEDETAV
jgi:crotonobetainyl-CoA:carnitine CoA-transferase CaiB-like acyl-CoA transferase